MSSTRPARPPPARYVDSTLRIVLEPAAEAHYQCFLCDHTEHVRGRRAVAAFVTSVRTHHRATCPANPERTTTR